MRPTFARCFLGNTPPGCFGRAARPGRAGLSRLFLGKASSRAPTVHVGGICSPDGRGWRQAPSARIGGGYRGSGALNISGTSARARRRGAMSRSRSRAVVIEPRTASLGAAGKATQGVKHSVSDSDWLTVRDHDYRPRCQPGPGSASGAPSDRSSALPRGSGLARLRASNLGAYSSRMPYEPPDPFQIARILRTQVLQLRALVERDPTRREYQDAANLAIQALAKLETANIATRK